MKVAPVSADLLIKLALAAVVVGGGVYLARRAWSALPGLPDFQLPDVGAWVDGAGRFVGGVGATVGDGAAWIGDTFGGTAHVTNPATLPPIDNPYGVYLTDEQRRIVDAAGDRSLWEVTREWFNDLITPDPIPLTTTPGMVADIRRIDNALGY